MPLTSPTTDSPVLETELPRAAEAASQARRTLTAHYGEELLDDALPHSKLVVSELINNAVLHGTGRIVLRTQLHDDRLRVEVVDDGTGEAPAICEAGGDGRGWGLRIVDAFSLRWGVHEGSTHVWADVAIR